MYIDFNKMSKGDRSDYINGIWSINQILKNTFLSIYLTPSGEVIEDNLNKLITGIHSGSCDLHKYLIVPLDSYLRLDCNKIYTVIKDYKSLFDGILYEEGNVYFVVRDVGNVIVGKIVQQFKPKEVGYSSHELVHNTMTYFNDDELELLIDKQVIEKKIEDYKMIVAHKLFPNIKKCESNNILIDDYGDGCFVATFMLEYSASNASGKKCYSQVVMHHKYKFIKI